MEIFKITTFNTITIYEKNKHGSFFNPFSISIAQTDREQ